MGYPRGSASALTASPDSLGARYRQSPSVALIFIFLPPRLCVRLDRFTGLARSPLPSESQRGAHFHLLTPAALRPPCPLHRTRSEPVTVRVPAWRSFSSSYPRGSASALTASPDSLGARYGQSPSVTLIFIFLPPRLCVRLDRFTGLARSPLRSKSQRGAHLHLLTPAALRPP